MKNAQVEAINTLNESLQFPKELPGLFLPKGYKEINDFMLIAEMPSMNEPNDYAAENENWNFGITRRDFYFQKMLKIHGLAGSYVTDIVKTRTIPGMPTMNKIKRWSPFLLKEIEIIKPKNIIVVGRRTYERSFLPFIEPFISKGIKIEFIFHYCSQVSMKKFEMRFKEVIKNMKV